MLERYTLPIPAEKESLLAKHAHGLLYEARETLRRLPGGHRSEAAEYELLPRPSAQLLPRATPAPTLLRAVLVYRRSCSTCTSALRFAATPLGSPKTSASRARSSARGKVLRFERLPRTSRSTLRTSTWGTRCARRSLAIRPGSARWSACQSTGATPRAAFLALSPVRTAHVCRNPKLDTTCHVKWFLP